MIKRLISAILAIVLMFTILPPVPVRVCGDDEVAPPPEPCEDCGELECLCDEFDERRRFFHEAQ